MTVKKPLASYAGTVKELQTGDTLPVAEADITFTDIPTNNVSAAAHGFVPKAPNDVTKFLNGLGAWSDPLNTRDLALSNRKPTGNVTIPDGYSAMIKGDINISGTNVINIQGDAVLAIG
jgi:hypothetical protein